jgi:ElaB/YqjD/DUF883 family membrane-anchored ribosome-binding protein
MATKTQSNSATDSAKQQVQDKAESAQEKLKDGAQQAQSRAREQIDQRSTQVGEQVSASAEALRTTSRNLREQGQGSQANAADRVAHHADRIGSYLTDSDADRLLSDAEDFGRRKPMAVIGIGIALGFAASRFLKASSRKRYEVYRTDPDRYQRAGNEYGRLENGPQLPVSSGGGHGA